MPDSNAAAGPKKILPLKTGFDDFFDCWIVSNE